MQFQKTLGKVCVHSYSLAIWGEHKLKLERKLDTLEELAASVTRAWYTFGWSQSYGICGARTDPERWAARMVVASSWRGLLLDPVTLFKTGERNSHRDHYKLRLSWYKTTNGYTPRQGPVPGVHKRGRRHRSVSFPRSIAEMRLNAAWCPEEGEPCVRACRKPDRLRHVDRWDMPYRDPQRSWKEQGKGRKSWDR